MTPRAAAPRAHHWAVLLLTSLGGCAAVPTEAERSPVLTGTYRYTAQLVGSAQPLLTGWLTLTDQPQQRLTGALRLAGACREADSSAPVDCVVPLDGAQAPDGTIRWRTRDGIAHTAVRDGRGRLVGRWTLEIPPDSLRPTGAVLRATFTAVADQTP